MKEKWLKQRNPPIPVDAYCPVDLEKGRVMVGLTHIGEPDGEIVGEFWYEGSDIHVKLFESKQNKEVS